jgi:hypothetical protein
MAKMFGGVDVKCLVEKTFHKYVQSSPMIRKKTSCFAYDSKLSAAIFVTDQLLLLPLGGSVTRGGS